MAIVEGSRLLNECLSRTLEDDEFAVAASCRDLDELSRSRARADVLILDVSRLGQAGFTTATLLSAPQRKLSVVAMDERPRSIALEYVLKRGWNGYFVKGDGLSELREVLRNVGRGQQAFSSAALKQLNRAPGGWQVRSDLHSPGVHLLTPREVEILRVLAEGESTRGCSARLSIAVSTVENHKANIRRKLGARRVSDLVRFAMQEGLVV
ncbi:MAG: response regulator transcription factor [Planctomycetes bacterium]|nr:response regulator transcription factor [Planctomycetota bacterium]